MSRFWLYQNKESKIHGIRKHTEKPTQAKGFDEEDCEPKEKDFEMRSGIYHTMDDDTNLLQKPDFDQRGNRETGFNQFSVLQPLPRARGFPPKDNKHLLYSIIDSNRPCSHIAVRHVTTTLDDLTVLYGSNGIIINHNHRQGYSTSCTFRRHSTKEVCEHHHDCNSAHKINKFNAQCS